VTRSSEVSRSRESPARNCSWSRTGFGSTMRPALSMVQVVVIMALYHFYYHNLVYSSSFP
jgi:hypothetical protein